MQNLSLKKIAEFTTQNPNNLESRADSESRFGDLGLDLDLESKTNSQSHQSPESSLLVSQNLVFAQKEKGYYPLPVALERTKR